MSVLTPAAEAEMNQHFEAMAQANGQVLTPGAAFAVAPNVVDKMQEEVIKVFHPMAKISRRVVTAEASQTISFGVGRGVMGRGTTTKNRAYNKGMSYATKDRTYYHETPFSDIDAYSHMGNLSSMLSTGYARSFAEEEFYIGLRGEEQHADPESFWDPNDPNAQLRKVDKGWATILAANLANHVVTYWGIGTNANSTAILYGKTRSIPVAAVTAQTVAAGVKTGIPLAGHGFVIGGLIRVPGDGNYPDTYVVQPETTADLVVIDKAYVLGNLGAQAVLEQRPDFSTIGEIVVVGKQTIPEGKRAGLESWIGENILNAYEQKLNASMNPATPSEFDYIQKVQQSHGQLPAFGLTDFEPDSLWVHNPATLGIYEQRGSRRREVNKQDMTAKAYTDKTYYSGVNVIEDLERMVVFQNLREVEAYTG